MAVNKTFTPEPSPGFEAEVRRTRTAGGVAIGGAARLPHWIGGVPTEIDIEAIRRVVTRRLNVDRHDVTTYVNGINWRWGGQWQQG